MLQCLQRLCAAPRVAEAFVNTPGAIGRVFTCLGGNVSSLGFGAGSGPLGEAVGFEAARLLLRLWAPAAARVGASPWRLRLSGGLGVGMGGAWKECSVNMLASPKG